MGDVGGGSGPTRWSAGTKGRRRRVGAESSSFFLIFFWFFTLFPTLFSFLNSKFSENEQSTLDLKQKAWREKNFYLSSLSRIRLWKWPIGRGFCAFPGCSSVCVCLRLSRLCCDCRCWWTGRWNSKSVACSCLWCCDFWSLVSGFWLFCRFFLLCNFGPPFMFLQVIIYSARFWKQKNWILWLWGEENVSVPELED